VALLYRQARAMAMGRGTAVLVRYDASSRGVVTVRQAVNSGDGSHCLGVPAPNCQANNWDAASTTNQLIATFDPSLAPIYSNVQLAFSNSQSNTEGDLCFSPLGRPYWRNGHVGQNNFQPLTEVPTIAVSPVDGIGLTRTVLVLPTGVSRLAL
jgi:hypothetical protein